MYCLYMKKFKKSTTHLKTFNQLYIFRYQGYYYKSYDTLFINRVQQLRRYDGTYRLAKYALLRIPATVYHVHIALPHIITLLVILFFRVGGTNINSLYAFTLLNLK